MRRAIATFLTLASLVALPVAGASGAAPKKPTTVKCAVSVKVAPGFVVKTTILLPAADGAKRCAVAKAALAAGKFTPVSTKNKLAAAAKKATTPAKKTALKKRVTVLLTAWAKKLSLTERFTSDRGADDAAGGAGGSSADGGASGVGGTGSTGGAGGTGGVDDTTVPPPAPDAGTGTGDGSGGGIAPPDTGGGGTGGVL